MKKKARLAYINGFRGPWGAGSSDGVGKDFMQFFEQGEKDGKIERKKHKGEVPRTKIVKNSYGDTKPNQEFEKLVKGVMAPYLVAFDAAYKKVGP